MKKPSHDKPTALDGPGLTPDDLRLMEVIARDYQITDPAGRLIAKTTRSALVRLLDCQAAIDRDGPTVVDKFGQVKGHPLLAAERDARAAVLAGLKALNLDVEPIHGRPGRPGKR